MTWPADPQQDPRQTGPRRLDGFREASAAGFSATEVVTTASATAGAIADAVAGLEIDAEVTFTIDDGAGHHTTGVLTATPSNGIDVRLQDPAVAWRALPLRGRGWRSLRDPLSTAANVLGSRGISVEVRTQGGRLVAAVDPARPRRLARHLSGSPYLRIGAATPRTMTVAAGRVTVPFAVGALIAGATLAAVVIATRSRPQTPRERCHC